MELQIVKDSNDFDFVLVLVLVPVQNGCRSPPIEELSVSNSAIRIAMMQSFVMIKRNVLFADASNREMYCSLPINSTNEQFISSTSTSTVTTDV